MKNLISGMFSSITDAELMLAINSYDDAGAENAVSDITENSLSTQVINSDTASNQASHHDSTEAKLDDFSK